MKPGDRVIVRRYGAQTYYTSDVIESMGNDGIRLVGARQSWRPAYDDVAPYTEKAWAAMQSAKSDLNVATAKAFRIMDAAFKEAKS